ARTRGVRGCDVRRAGEMDGRGRLAQSLNPAGPAREPIGLTVEALPRRRVTRRALARAARDSRFERSIARYDAFFTSLKFYRGGGIAVSLLIVAASIGYGVFKGGHTAEIVAAFKNARDVAGSTVGFRIASIAFTGNKHLNREEILARAGVTGTSSLLFFDV